MATVDLLRHVLMYLVVPLWFAAGVADYICHRAARIEETAGSKESLLHWLQFALAGTACWRRCSWSPARRCWPS